MERHGGKYIRNYIPRCISRRSTVEKRGAGEASVEGKNRGKK